MVAWSLKKVIGFKDSDFKSIFEGLRDNDRWYGPAEQHYEAAIN